MASKYCCKLARAASALANERGGASRDAAETILNLPHLRRHAELHTHV